MKNEPQTAQEMTHGACNYESPAPPGPTVVTQDQYNTVIDGLRMQLHLLSLNNRKLRSDRETFRLQRDKEAWNVSACYEIAVGIKGWQETIENHEAVKQVKMLRQRADSLDNRIGELERTIESQHELMKGRDSDIRKLRKIIRNRVSISKA